MSEDELSDEALLEAFERCELVAGQFSHRQHLRVGYLYLTRHDFGQAVSRICGGLKTLVAHLGVKDKYNETITVAYMALINERLCRDGDPGEWPQFIDAHPDLLDAELLYRYYDRAALFTATARRAFVMSAGTPDGNAVAAGT